MFILYLIQHSETKQIYIGKTNNLERRLKEHNKNKQISTIRKNGKWVLIYAEAYRSKIDASNRELKLKHHGTAKHKLKERLLNSFLS